jgi:hypothetical protein
MLMDKWKRSSWNLVELNIAFLELPKKKILNGRIALALFLQKYPNLNINISQLKWQCLRFISWIETNQNWYYNWFMF